MSTWDSATQSKIEENFMHQKDFDFFYLKEFIHLLSGNISIDGTFDPCKHIPGITQLFCINVQIYDHINDKTHIQPILIAALPDKKPKVINLFSAMLKRFIRT